MPATNAMRLAAGGNVWAMLLCPAWPTFRRQLELQVQKFPIPKAHSRFPGSDPQDITYYT